MEQPAKTSIMEPIYLPTAEEAKQNDAPFSIINELEIDETFNALFAAATIVEQSHDTCKIATFDTSLPCIKVLGSGPQELTILPRINTSPLEGYKGMLYEPLWTFRKEGLKVPNLPVYLTSPFRSFNFLEGDLGHFSLGEFYRTILNLESSDHMAILPQRFQTHQSIVYDNIPLDSARLSLLRSYKYVDLPMLELYSSNIKLSSIEIESTYVDARDKGTLDAVFDFTSFVENVKSDSDLLQFFQHMIPLLSTGGFFQFLEPRFSGVTDYSFYTDAHIVCSGVPGEYKCVEFQSTCYFHRAYAYDPAHLIRLASLFNCFVVEVDPFTYANGDFRAYLQNNYRIIRIVKKNNDSPMLLSTYFDCFNEYQNHDRDVQPRAHSSAIEHAPTSAITSLIAPETTCTVLPNTVKLFIRFIGNGKARVLSYREDLGILESNLNQDIPYWFVAVSCMRDTMKFSPFISGKQLIIDGREFIIYDIVKPGSAFFHRQIVLQGFLTTTGHAKYVPIGDLLEYITVKNYKPPSGTFNLMVINSFSICAHAPDSYVCFSNQYDSYAFQDIISRLKLFEHCSLSRPIMRQLDLFAQSGMEFNAETEILEFISRYKYPMTADYLRHSLLNVDDYIGLLERFRCYLLFKRISAKDTYFIPNQLPHFYKKMMNHNRQFPPPFMWNYYQSISKAVQYGFVVRDRPDYLKGESDENKFKAHVERVLEDKTVIQPPSPPALPFSEMLLELLRTIDAIEGSDKTLVRLRALELMLKD